MNRSDMVEVLEICLQKLEGGVPLDVILANYPDQREELRELLLSAMAAQLPHKGTRVPASAQVDSRRRLLARADELAEQQHRWGFLAWALRLARDNFQSAIIVVTSLALLFIALRSVGALPAGLLSPQPAAIQGDPTLPSSGAQPTSAPIPGSGALPVSPTLPGNARDQLNQAITADQKLAGQVESMIAARQSGDVTLPGFLKAQDGGWAVGSVFVQVPSALQEQAQALSGTYVEARGLLDGNGILWAQEINPRVITLAGRLESTGINLWLVDSLPLRVSGQTAVAGSPRVGEQVQVRVSRLEGQEELLALSITGSRPTPAGTPLPSPEATLTDKAAPGPVEPALATPQPSPAQLGIHETEEHHDDDDEEHDDQHHGKDDHEEDDDHEDGHSGVGDDRKH